MMAPIGVQCDFCTGSEISGHFDECPMVTTMPRIVAILEAAEHLIERDPAFVYRGDRPAYAALVAALRGDEVTP